MPIPHKILLFIVFILFVRSWAEIENYTNDDL